MRSAGLMSTEDDDNDDDYISKNDSSTGSWNFFNF